MLSSALAIEHLTFWEAAMAALAQSLESFSGTNPGLVNCTARDIDLKQNHQKFHKKV
jgi:hypothetical protein